jgi:hypothetical protein
MTRRYTVPRRPVPGSVLRSVRAIMADRPPTAILERNPDYTAADLADAIGWSAGAVRLWESFEAPWRVRLQLVGLLEENGRDPRVVPGLVEPLAPIAQSA